MDQARAAAIQRGLRLEVVGVAWMVIEAALALGAGLAARSLLLTAFGLDSGIEILSGLVLMRRLAQERAGQPAGAVARLEARTARLSAVLLLLLCAYIVVAAATGVAFGIRPSLSVVGIAVSACAVLAMPALAVAKARVNRVLDSASLRADIAETAGCAYLAATTLVGLGVAAWLNLWWVQYVAGLALLVWLIPEVREAFEAGQEGHGTAAPGRA